MFPAHREFKDRRYGTTRPLGEALSNPHRIEILELLAQGERTVESLAAEMVEGTDEAQGVRGAVEMLRASGRSARPLPKGFPSGGPQGLPVAHGTAPGTLM